MPEAGYNFIDHLADIGIHSFGGTLQQALQQAIHGMFQYMVPNARAELFPGDWEMPPEGLQAEAQEDVVLRRIVNVKATTMDMMLYHLLSDVLFLFHSDGFVPCLSVAITAIQADGFPSLTSALDYQEQDPDARRFSCRCVLLGGLWSPRPLSGAPREMGTEIKAITKEGLKIEVCEEDGLWHCTCIVDI